MNKVTTKERIDFLNESSLAAERFIPYFAQQQGLRVDSPVVEYDKVVAAAFKLADRLCDRHISRAKLLVPELFY